MSEQSAWPQLYFLHLRGVGSTGVDVGEAHYLKAQVIRDQGYEFVLRNLTASRFELSVRDWTLKPLCQALTTGWSHHMEPAAESLIDQAHQLLPAEEAST